MINYRNQDNLSLYTVNVHIHFSCGALILLATWHGLCNKFKQITQTIYGSDLRSNYFGTNKTMSFVALNVDPEAWLCFGYYFYGSFSNLSLDGIKEKVIIIREKRSDSL